MSTLLTLPVPHTTLSPNSRASWQVRAARKAEARRIAYSVAMSAMYAGGFAGAPYRRARVRTHFIFRRQGRRDKDNLAARMKSVWDGFTDAGVWVDDDQVDYESPVLVINPEAEREEVLVRIEEVV